MVAHEDARQYQYQSIDRLLNTHRWEPPKIPSTTKEAYHVQGSSQLQHQLKRFKKRKTIPKLQLGNGRRLYIVGPVADGGRD